MKLFNMVLGGINSVTSFIKSLTSNKKVNVYSRNVALTVLLANVSGVSIAEIAAARECSVDTVKRHLEVASTQEFRETGFFRTKTGPKDIFTEKEKREISEFVRDCYPYDLGINTAYWNAEIIAHVVQVIFGKNVHATTIKRILRKYGQSYHKPEVRNLRRDEAAIRNWTEMIAPELIATDRKEGRSIFFIDQSSCRGDKPRMRTWGPRGKRLIVRQGERVGVNIMGALGIGCKSTFLTTQGTIDSNFVIGFFEHLLAENPGKELAIYLDGATWHTSAAVRKFLDENPQIKIRRLPKYAPELNPIELVWARLKNNGIRIHSYKGVKAFENHIGQELLEISDAFLLHKALINAEELQYIADGLTRVA